jgi:drug/metabolite transporter (DMT)-like permease
MGGTGILLYNFCFFYGFQYISASRGTLIVSLNPTVIGLIAYFFLKEKVSPIQWLGMGLSVIGICIIMINKDPNLLVTDENSWKGDLLLLGCVLSWATYSTISKPVVQEIGAIYTVFCAIVIGTILLGIGVIYAGYLTPFYIKNITLSGWLNLAFLGVVATALCYVLYYQVIHLIGSSKSATYIALVPVFGVLLAFLLLDEILSIPIIIGGALAITGVYLSNKAKKI